MQAVKQTREMGRQSDTYRSSAHIAAVASFAKQLRENHVKKLQAAREEHQQMLKTSKLYRTWCRFRKQKLGCEWDTFAAFKSWAESEGYTDDCKFSITAKDKRIGVENCQITRGAK